MTTIYKFSTTVKSVERLRRIVRGRMVGGQTVLEEEDLGWFICLEGSWEKLHVGVEEPEFKCGGLRSQSAGKVKGHGRA